MTYREKFHNITEWKHKVLIVELFHLLRLSKAPKWREEDTAKYFNVSIALVSENLRLARALKIGIIDGCTSRDKAIKLLRKLK